MNPIMGLLNQINPVAQLAKTLQSAGDPQAMINQMAQMNPQIRQVQQFIAQSGGDPKTAFYNLARQQGVDPEQILNQVRSLMR